MTDTRAAAVAPSDRVRLARRQGAPPGGTDAPRRELGALRGADALRRENERLRRHAARLRAAVRRIGASLDAAGARARRDGRSRAELLDAAGRRLLTPLTSIKGSTATALDAPATLDRGGMLQLTAKGATAKNGTGSVMSMFSIMIEDTTMPLVSVKDDAYEAIMMALGEDPLNPGDEVMIMNDDVFMYDDEMVSMSFGASVEGMSVGASASGEMVTLMAMEPGEAKVTVTATATPMSDSLIITQDRANVAQVTFPVMVELADLMITLSGPEDMNIAEGMSAMVTATANRAVTEDTMVELIQTDGTASPADYMAEPIMIMAGEMMGTTMVMAVEDDMMEDMEMLTLEGRVGAMKTNTVMFYLWDAAVPALPIIAQLLLALFLAIGGYRRYLRR